MSVVNPYHSYINWNFLSSWKLVRIGTPMDGSCLFHAIINAYFEPYRSEILHGTPISRFDIIKRLRTELSIALSSPIDPNHPHPTYYESLNFGNTKEFSQAVPEFSLSYMQNELNSNSPIGYGYMEFIGNILNKDIYILDSKRQDIYITDELPLTIKGTRKSIVIYYMSGHYELVGIENNDGSYSTHFSPNHSLIKTLYNRVKECLTHSSD